MSLGSRQEELIYRTLDDFQIELPSWAFANTGTRFGKFLDPSAPSSIQEKLADAAEVNRFKPFEPAFYHTDIADWGMALRLAKQAGKQAFVLVDTGHHYQAQNIEPIVAWLLDDGMLGGFHLNDRRFADDDLTLGSIDPYQVFRIFHEICFYRWETGREPDIAFMVDQSHNLKPKTEEMIQTIVAAQEFFAKAAIVNHEELSLLQNSASLIDSEEMLGSAFQTDVRPTVAEWRKAKGLAASPLAAFRESGYLARVSKERGTRAQAVSSYA